MGESKYSGILKGGHAPAEKIAGGIRRTRKKFISESDKNQKQEGQSAADYGDELEEQSKNMLVHGDLVAKMNKDYTKEAIRAYHDKQVPQIYKSTKPNITLFQPSKQ